ncbi:MAG: hypothetical protein Q8M31_08075 [Beijerinckiaceae bacterium]|nr:hypothetical protein [Beijerinckiaceae bacterium]
MTRVLYSLVAAGVFAGASAFAQPAPIAPTAPGERDGRFSMTPAPDGGFLRLDTRTGAVSHCRLVDGALQCRSGADERAALHSEIDRLARENEDLKRKMAQVTPGDRLRNALPSEKEIDTALGFMERVMRRMMNLFRESPTQDRI